MGPTQPPYSVNTSGWGIVPRLNMVYLYLHSPICLHGVSMAICLIKNMENVALFHSEQPMASAGVCNIINRVIEVQPLCPLRKIYEGELNNYHTIKYTNHAISILRTQK
jgi:hypothetical protein